MTRFKKIAQILKQTYDFLITLDLGLVWTRPCWRPARLSAPDYLLSSSLPCCEHLTFFSPSRCLAAAIFIPDDKGNLASPDDDEGEGAMPIRLYKGGGLWCRLQGGGCQAGIIVAGPRCVHRLMVSGKAGKATPPLPLRPLLPRLRPHCQRWRGAGSVSSIDLLSSRVFVNST